MEKLSKSIGWATTEELCVKLCGLVSTFGLTIWLSPDDFAISAMAVLFVALAKVVVDSGFGEAIVRADSVEQDGLSSIFWINLFIGSILILLGLYKSMIPRVITSTMFAIGAVFHLIHDIYGMM